MMNHEKMVEETEWRTHLGVEIADQQDTNSGREGGESQPGGPGEGQRGQASGQSGDCQAWIGEGHWERWDEWKTI